MKDSLGILETPMSESKELLFQFGLQIIAVCCPGELLNGEHTVGPSLFLSCLLQKWLLIKAGGLVWVWCYR